MSRIVPCLHISVFYQKKWQDQKCIGYNILRQGYLAWANGTAVEISNGMVANNLYSTEKDFEDVIC